MSSVETRLVSLISHLVRFPTVSDNLSALSACIAWIQRYVQEHIPGTLSFQVQQLSSHGKPSLVIFLGDATPSLLLCGHIDVVPGEDERAYQATVCDDGFVYGRGVADMKGPIAALLDVLVAEQLPRLGILITSDEEVGGQDGVKHFLDEIAWRPEAVVLPDGGAGLRLVTEQKGDLRLRVKVNGRAAHSARPWQGRSAIELLYHGYKALHRAYPPIKSEEDWRTSITLTNIHTTGAYNAVPWQAEGILDVRYPRLTTATADPAAALLTDVQRRLKRYNAQVEPLLHASNFVLDTNASVVALLQSAAKECLGYCLPQTRECGASDARYFSSVGIPTLVFAPEAYDWHGPQERISIHSLMQFRAMCAAFAQLMLCS